MKNVRAKPKVFIRWVQFGSERIPSFRDVEGQLIYPFNEYLDELSCILHEKDLPRPTIKTHIEAAVYALKAFAQFLADSETELASVDDGTIVAFRTRALKAVKEKPTYRGNENKAKRTVNVKLKQVYKFLSQCQKAHRVDANTIGPTGCRVTSTLPLKGTGVSETALGEKQLYPKLFEGIGSRSSTGTGQYWATDDDVDKLEDHFWRTSRETHTAVRNVLLVRLGEQLSWRISSINSLEVRQFSAEELARQQENDAFSVCPPFQKRGATETFTVRWELAHEVARFVREERAAHLERLGSTESAAQHRVFITIGGTPLTDHYATEILADGFKAIAAPGSHIKGRGSHSLRRRGAKQRMRDEIAFRRANGLSLAQEDVERAVQAHLGHSSSFSQRAYSQAITELRSSSQEEVLQRRLLQKQVSNDSLKRLVKERDERIAELEKQLQGKKASRRTSKPKTTTRA